MLKTDIVRFFPNVDHEVLRGAISRRIADERVLALVDCILASGEGVLKEEATATYFPGDDLFAISRPRGLPIGNLMSQIRPSASGVTFLGWQLAPGSMRLAQPAVRRFSRRLQQLRWLRERREIVT